MKQNKILFEKKVSGSIGKNYWLGVHYGALYGKIIIFKNQIIIKYFGLTLILKKREIKYIKKYQGAFGFLSKGIRIYHNKLHTPSFIVIWLLSRDRDNLFKKLKKIGYKYK